MPFDENGREYKICEYAACKRPFYRHEFPWINEFNWKQKRFCCKIHKLNQNNRFKKQLKPPEK